MISTRELQYVSLWAQKIPMPGIEYSIKVLEELKKSLELYKEKYKDKEYSLIFSNSEEIEFEILSKNLCHMLGVDSPNINGDYFNEYRYHAFGSSEQLTSYDLLHAIIENKEKVAELDNDPHIKAKAINYYKSAVKCAIFGRLSNFEKFNFAAINYRGPKEDFDYGNSKLLFLPSNESVTPYFMMGIKKSNDTEKYIVSTLMAPQNPKEFFQDQEVIIPTQIIVSTMDKLIKLQATPEEKIGLLTMYYNIVNKYGIQNRLNIYGDYENILNDLSRSRVLKK